ncbi:MAG: hypothetical protein AAF639_44345 [Chloroflexota bacterium]
MINESTLEGNNQWNTHFHQDLIAHGLNLVAVFDLNSLSSAILSQIEMELAGANLEATNYQRLVLLGNAGTQLWTSLIQSSAGPTNYLADDNPVDQYSSHIATRFIHNHLGNAATHILYPGNTYVSLIQLGELAGWSHSSPLGQGIHPTYGLWFAYRVLFVTEAELPIASVQHSESPCITCVDKPCISTCLAKAIHPDDAFNIPACYGHRLAENSSCVDRCLARLACPIGAEHRYALAQIQHHYGVALRTAKQYDFISS